MTTLQEIIARDAQYLNEVTVSVDTRFETVEITDDNNFLDEIFLQGQDAHEFIMEAQEIYEKAQTVSLQDVYLHLARAYVDCLWN